jgi:hypothetical protein
MFALKLSLVAGSMLLASLVSRRFGHTAAGMLAGLPMIAGPIMGVLLIDLAPDHARAIALGTLVGLPAMALHYVVFAYAARRWPWAVCLLLANAAFVVAGVLLMQLPLPAAVSCVLAFAAPALAQHALSRVEAHRTAVPVSMHQLALRLVVALSVATAIVLGAGWLPPGASGLLLALPITANVLPCFALAFHGAAPTQSLMAGLARGMFGFAAFFVSLYVVMPWLGVGAAFMVACAAAFATVAAVLHGFRRKSLGST